MSQKSARQKRMAPLGTWWWMSFKDARGALGGCWVYGENFVDITQRARKFGIFPRNPRGGLGVKAASIGQKPLPPRWKPLQFYTPREVERIGGHTF